MVRPRRRRHQRRQRSLALGLGLVLAAAIVVTAEGGLRLAGVQPAYQADLLGGWRMLPEQHAQTVRSREGASFVLSTNADGMRTAWPRQRTPGVWRVALLGDSIVFGWGVDDGGTVADGLQEALEAQLGGPVEVINAAQPGYSTVQSARFFGDIVQHYRPDLTVLFLAMHDHNAVLVSDAEHLHGARGPLATLRVLLAQHSRLYQLGRQWLVPLSAQPFLRPDQPPGELRVARVDNTERAAAIAEIRSTLATWDGAFALGHMPFISDLESAVPMHRDGEAWANDYADAGGISIVDLRRCCGPDGGHLVLPHDPGHLTAEGGLAAGRYGSAPVTAILYGMGAPASPPPGSGSSR